MCMCVHVCVFVCTWAHASAKLLCKQCLLPLLGRDPDCKDMKYSLVIGSASHGAPSLRSLLGISSGPQALLRSIPHRTL